MSNYLNHLVARSLNLVQTVQPRLPSRFEAPTGLAQPLEGQAKNWQPNAVSTFSDEVAEEVQWETRTERREDRGEEERVTWHPQTARFNFPLVSLEPLPQPLSYEKRGVTEERDTRGAKIELRREDRSISPLLPASSYQEEKKEDTGALPKQNPIERSPNRQQAKPTPDEDSSAAESIEPSSQNLASKIVAQEQQFLSGYASETENPPASIKMTARAKQPNSEGKGIQPVAPLVSSANAPLPVTFPAKNTLSSTTILPQPSGNGSRETPPKEPIRLDSPFTPPRSSAIAPPLPTPSFQPPTPPPPTIQVTIGRIEVRATQPPDKSKQQRPAPPRMSLNEYLQQQKPGGRA
jgi:hypothetical protein